jgi:hypothetical protein
MHDLRRRYARDHAAGLPGSEQAVERLLDYYQYTAARADARLARQTRPGPSSAVPAGLPATPGLDDDSQALAWARADRASLLACLDHATTTGQLQSTLRFIPDAAEIAANTTNPGGWAQLLLHMPIDVLAAGTGGVPSRSSRPQQRRSVHRRTMTICWRSTLGK